MQRLLSELTPGKAKEDLTALQAIAIVPSVQPRDLAGKTRRRLAAEQSADLVGVEVDKKIKALSTELKAIALSRGSHPMDLRGVGPVVPARTLADVGDVAQFADQNRFASWTGTVQLDASSTEQWRHRLSRAGNRRMNHMIHIAAHSQIRFDTDGWAYYRCKRAEGKKPLEAIMYLKRKISDAPTTSSSPTLVQLKRDRDGTAERLKNPARPTCPRPSTLRISHLPDPHPRRYRPPRPLRTPGPGSAPTG